jgi:hypothetical protein
VLQAKSKGHSDIDFTQFETLLGLIGAFFVQRCYPVSLVD